MTLLETHSLVIGYGQKVIQQGLSLKIEEGKIIALMGQNGVGKTTFLKTINGLLAPLGGEIRLGGKDITKITRQEIATRFSLVLTEKPSNSNLTVVELVALGRHPYSNWLGLLNDLDKKAIQTAMDKTKINYIAEKKVSELSDGQLQKVMIARALAQETQLIVLDEPVAHLDLNNKIEVMLLLKDIAKEGKGILISTHDIQVTTQISDELWLFDFMSSVESGIPEDLILNNKLEKALFLEEHPYDMIHHRLISDGQGPKIKVSGDPKIKYWTEQALTRLGFSLGPSEVEVDCQLEGWRVNGDADKNIKSIKDLFDLLSTMKVSN